MAGSDISAYSTGVYDTSAYNTNEYNNSAYNTSAYEIGAYNTSAFNTSAFDTSVHNTSAFDTSTYNNSAYNNSDYDTSAYNTSVNGSSGVSDNAFPIYYFVLSVPCMVAFIYGVASWCIIKKFRHFRNYVFLSVILANAMRLLSLAFNKSSFAVCMISFQCWLVVLCYIFYIDFVKVFNIDIRRKYLKTGLFAWGLPFIVLAVPAIYGFLYVILGFGREINNTLTNFVLTLVFLIFFTPAAINLVVYIIVVYSLFRASDTGASTSNNKWRRFYIATLIFIFSNILSFFHSLFVFVGKDSFVGWIGGLGDLLHTIALDVYIIIVKRNRELWKEYFKRRSIQTSLEMRNTTTTST